KSMKSYTKQADTETVTYEDGSVVEINMKTDQYTVSMGDGFVIAKDYSTFAPIKENTCLACSRDGGLISYQIPHEWKDPHKIEVFRIDTDGKPVKSGFRMKGRSLELDTEAHSPYKVLYNE
ncbi:MAG: hypothetical protein V2B15_12065, partial [Bacteroidota bacterium]